MGLGRRRDGLIIFGFALALAGVAWLVGFSTAYRTVPPGPPVPSDVEAPKNFSLYGEVWSLVNREFYGERPAPRNITYKAIEGMVGALDDPYAAFVDSEEAESGSARFLPQIVHSMGAWVEPVRQGILVVSVLPDSPASEAGLVPGDVILGIDRESIAGLAPSEVHELLEGEEGTTVELIVRTEEQMPRAVEITRAATDVPAVEVRRPEPSVGYIRITNLDPGEVEELDAALRELDTDELEAVVIDLRDNPGGDLDTALQVAGRFMEGTVWVETDGDGTRRERTADASGAPDFDLPDTVLVLVNSGTAGAAEMLAAALRSNVGARLIGEQTFGKGTIQAIRPLSDSSLVRLTVGTWSTPAGEQVDGDGLSPDVVVEGADAQLRAALKAAVAERAGTKTAGG